MNLRQLLKLCFATLFVLVVTGQAQGAVINVALDPQVTATATTWRAGSPPQDAVDGDPATGWATTVFTASLSIDLGRLYSVNQIDLVGIQTGLGLPIYRGYKLDYTLEAKALAGDPWTTLGTGTLVHFVDPIDTFALPGTPIRYLRFTASPTTAGPHHWAHLREMRVFADPAVVPTLAAAPAATSVPAPAPLLLWLAGGLSWSAVARLRRRSRPAGAG